MARRWPPPNLQKKLTHWVAWGRWKWCKRNVLALPFIRGFIQKQENSPKKNDTQSIYHDCIYSFSFPLVRVADTRLESLLRMQARLLEVEGNQRTWRNPHRKQPTLTRAQDRTPDPRAVRQHLTLHIANMLSWRYLLTQNSQYARILPYIIPYRSTEPRTCFEAWSIAIQYYIVFPTLYKIFVFFFQ